MEEVPSCFVGGLVDPVEAESVAVPRCDRGQCFPHFRTSVQNRVLGLKHAHTSPQAILGDLHMHHLTDYLWELLGRI